MKKEQQEVKQSGLIIRTVVAGLAAGAVYVVVPPLSGALAVSMLPNTAGFVGWLAASHAQAQGYALGMQVAPFLSTTLAMSPILADTVVGTGHLVGKGLSLLNPVKWFSNQASNKPVNQEIIRPAILDRYHVDQHPVDAHCLAELQAIKNTQEELERELEVKNDPVVEAREYGASLPN